LSSCRCKPPWEQVYDVPKGIIDFDDLCRCTLRTVPVWSQAVPDTFEHTRNLICEVASRGEPTTLVARTKHYRWAYRVGNVNVRVSTGCPCADRRQPWMCWRTLLLSPKPLETTVWTRGLRDNTSAQYRVSYPVGWPMITHGGRSDVHFEPNRYLIRRGPWHGEERNGYTIWAGASVVALGPGMTLATVRLASVRNDKALWELLRTYHVQEDGELEEKPPTRKTLFEEALDAGQRTKVSRFLAIRTRPQIIRPTYTFLMEIPHRKPA
jgi:hypothetical protein